MEVIVQFRVAAALCLGEKVHGTHCCEAEGCSGHFGEEKIFCSCLESIPYSAVFQPAVTCRRYRSLILVTGPAMMSTEPPAQGVIAEVEQVVCEADRTHPLLRTHGCLPSLTL